MCRSSNMPPCFSTIFVSMNINTWVVEGNSKVMKKRLANLGSSPTYVHAVVHMGPGCWFAANLTPLLRSLMQIKHRSRLGYSFVPDKICMICVSCQSHLECFLFFSKWKLLQNQMLLKVRNVLGNHLQKIDFMLLNNIRLFSRFKKTQQICSFFP